MSHFGLSYKDPQQPGEQFQDYQERASAPPPADPCPMCENGEHSYENGKVLQRCNACNGTGRASTALWELGKAIAKAAENCCTKCGGINPLSGTTLCPTCMDTKVCWSCGEDLPDDDDGYCPSCEQRRDESAYAEERRDAAFERD